MVLQTLKPWGPRLSKKSQWLQLPGCSWLSLAHTRVCSRVTIAGVVPSFERFACSVIPAAPETDVGRLLDQGQLSSTTKPCYSLPTSGSLVFGRVPTTLTEKNDSLCLSHSGKLYGLCPAPASPLGAWNFSLCSWIKKLMWKHLCQASLRHQFMYSVTAPYWGAVLWYTLPSGLHLPPTPLFLTESPLFWNLGSWPAQCLLNSSSASFQPQNSQHGPEASKASRLTLHFGSPTCTQHPDFMVLFNKLKNSSRTALTSQLWM